jgi:hypothetical protein
MGQDENVKAKVGLLEIMFSYAEWLSSSVNTPQFRYTDFELGLD